MAGGGSSSSSSPPRLSFWSLQRWLRMVHSNLWWSVGFAFWTQLIVQPYMLKDRCFVTLPGADVASDIASATLGYLADFGPPLPRGGVRGVLLQLTPPDGCSHPGHADDEDKDKDGPAWIALVEEEGVCSFKDKVLNAQLAGAAAIIVYNVTDDQLHSTGITQNTSDIRIPSVLISKRDDELVQYLAAKAQSKERVTALLQPITRIVLLIPALIWLAFVAFLDKVVVCCISPDNVVYTPDEENVVGVKCQAAPAPDVVVISVGKVEEGEVEETAHLMRDCERQ